MSTKKITKKVIETFLNEYLSDIVVGGDGDTPLEGYQELYDSDIFYELTQMIDYKDTYKLSKLVRDTLNLYVKEFMETNKLKLILKTDIGKGGCNVQKNNSTKKSRDG